MLIDNQVSLAWVQAAADLGIRVTAPFSIPLENGADRWYEAFIGDFGGPNGTVVGNQNDTLGDIRKERGYYASNLWPSYRVYTRQFFIDTLNDWGWFGERDKQPLWYSGKRWS